MTIKAIETRYAGCRFRSRLEARWAVFFDAAGIRWEYEPQGFEIDDRPYLPDFYLPRCKTWVEVKGDVPSDETLDFLHAAAAQLTDEGGTMLLLGPIPELPRPVNYDIAWRGLGDWVYGDWSYRSWGFGRYSKNSRPWWLTHDFDPRTEWDEPRTVPFTFHAFDHSEVMDEHIAVAYRAARSARFEYGEHG